MELGLYGFGELTPDPRSALAISPVQRRRDLIDEIELADQVGLDVFGVGEHHHIGRERGWLPLSRQDFDRSRTLRGANFVGSPEEVAEKILFQYEIFQHQRFLLQPSVGTLPHRSVLHAIELYGTRVAPIVRRAIARRAPPPRD